MEMKLSQFNFKFSNDLIAKYPAKFRDESRLMVLHRDSFKIEHKVFKDIVKYFDEGDVFVVNNTKVFPARLYGNKEKTGAEIEVFLLRELNPDKRLWDVLVDPARKIRIGNKLYFGPDDVMVAEVIDNTTSRGRTVRFLFDGTHDEFRKTLFSLGEMPVPRWVRHKNEALDQERYQTIFAREEGAVAVPAAGLHFSRELLKRMEIDGIKIAEVTLHMSLGSFREVDVEDLPKHRMDSEQVIVRQEATEIINRAKDNNHRICAIGATTLRAMEASATTQGRMQPFEGWTNKFIFPPHEFTVPEAVVTNFHFPHSTMLMAVTSFSGYDLMKRAYEIAVKDKYRFGTYGDAMLIV
jgi:S-adenosylmethionine:tRNA ribosyltransferase-isomerase